MVEARDQSKVKEMINGDIIMRGDVAKIKGDIQIVKVVVIIKGRTT